MRGVIYSVGLAVIIATSASGAAEKINISGVMESGKGPAAVINGQLCHVNDQIGGGTITKIDLNGVTISRNGEKTVHQVGNSGGSTKAGKSVEKTKKRSGFSAWLQGFQKKKSKPRTTKKEPAQSSSTSQAKQTSSSCAAASSALKNKMNRAELLYKKEQSEFNQFRSRRLSRCKSKSELERAIKEYNTMLRVNLNKIRHLELPCSASAEYNQWLSSYQSRLNSMRQSNLREVEATVKKAGYSSDTINLSGTDLLRGK